MYSPGVFMITKDTHSIIFFETLRSPIYRVHSQNRRDTLFLRLVTLNGCIIMFLFNKDES